MAGQQERNSKAGQQQQPDDNENAKGNQKRKNHNTKTNKGRNARKIRIKSATPHKKREAAQFKGSKRE
jgi:hypothetical protein